MARRARVALTPYGAVLWLRRVGVAMDLNHPDVHQANVDADDVKFTLELLSHPLEEEV